MRLSWMEILLILFALLLLFGSSRLPTLGKSLGSALRNFKKGFADEVDAADEERKTLAPLPPSKTAVEDKSTRENLY